MASVVRARSVESGFVDFAMEPRSAYCCAPDACRVHLPANIPSGVSDPTRWICALFPAAGSLGKVICSLVPSGCTSSPNSPCSAGGSEPNGTMSAVRST